MDSMSSPFRRTAPAVTTPGGEATSPSSESAVTDLPEPDSPMIPRHSPADTSKLTPSAAR